MQESLPNSSIENIISDSGLVDGFGNEPLNQLAARPKASTLIEFPGNARPRPEWRKQLSQRVREVQERRAREAAEEAAAAQEAGMLSCTLPSAQLELVPDLEPQVMNPIVSKALERIERARRSEQVVAGSDQAFTGSAVAPAFAPAAGPETAPDVVEPEVSETKPRLTVVAALRPEVEKRAKPQPERKPVRIISDSVDDVALSYLETCLSVPPLASDDKNESAGLGRRVIAASLDLFLVALMAAPVAAVIEFSDGEWSDPRVIGLMGGITIVTMFSYLTICIALTGRTLAMRILSLRTIDTQTGLIPTGGQAMKRSVGYIFALAVLGLGVIYALVDPDHRTIYDRFSKTIVIHD